MSHRIWFKCIVYLLMYQKNAFLNTCFYFTLQSRLNLDTRYSTGFNSIRTYNLVNCQISEHRFKWYVIDDDRDTSMRWDLVGQTGFILELVFPINLFWGTGLDHSYQWAEIWANRFGDLGKDWDTFVNELTGLGIMRCRIRVPAVSPSYLFFFFFCGWTDVWGNEMQGM